MSMCSVGAGFRLGEDADGLDGLQRVAEGLDGGGPAAELGGAGASVEVAEEVRVECHADVAVGEGIWSSGKRVAS